MEAVIQTYPAGTAMYTSRWWWFSGFNYMIVLVCHSYRWNWSSFWKLRLNDQSEKCGVGRFRPFCNSSILYFQAILSPRCSWRLTVDTKTPLGPRHCQNCTASLTASLFPKVHYQQERAAVQLWACCCQLSWCVEQIIILAHRTMPAFCAASCDRWCNCHYASTLFPYFLRTLTLTLALLH